VTIVDIRAKARRLSARKQGLGLIIVDYLQLMSHHRRVDNRQQEIAEISRSLKLLAKELKIPVIAVSQLNRDPERRQDKRPQLSDLRECVPGDTLVQLADGQRRAIRDLVGTEPDVLAVGTDGRIFEARSDKVWPVGERQLFEVRLASGRTIRATEEHRLLGASGWKRVRDIREGDRLGIARRLPEPARTIRWHDDRVALLGQLIGDGSYLRARSLRYTTASEDNSRLVARAATEQFGARVKRIRGGGAWHQLFIGGNGTRWRPTGVSAWLRELGIYGQGSADKRIPGEAFRLSNQQVAILLRHLWATDGCVHVRKPGQRGSHTVYFSTSSEGLAYDVATLLLRFGIVARIKRAAKHGYRPWWRVHVCGSVDQRWFLRHVGAFGPRVRPARELATALHEIVPNTNVDTLAPEIIERVRRAMREKGVTTRGMARLRGTSYGGTAHFGFAPSRSLVAQYGELLGEPDLIGEAESDVFWDRVTEVVVAGSEVVYDMTVPGPSNWLAGRGTAISHNSGAIEQDADVVMFIHRDDSDPAKKGLADLVVAKHRNGPTDSIPLTFLPHLTQFKDFHPAS
jgi:replicative DNA helicase